MGARRPFRLFVLLWAGLAALWLLSGAIGFRNNRRADVPPLPEAVPYADFLPGGARAPQHGRLLLDPWLLPAHDPKLLSPYINISTWSGEDGTNRLLGQSFTTDGAYGWPRQWVSWLRCTFYDVTDPGRPFARTTFPTMRQVQWKPLLVSWWWTIDDGSAYWTGTWKWATTLVWFLGLGVAAGALVLGVWRWQRLQLRRRLRRGGCPHCGYDLRGGADGACPECGRDQHAAPPAARSVRAGRLFAVLWVALVLLWGIVALTASRYQAFTFPMPWR